MKQSPFDLRFIAIVGKGGVGKTTVTAALALSLAARGKRVLIAMCNAKERISYGLEVPPLGPQIRNVQKGIDAVNMEPSAALEEYGLMVLKVRALYKLVFENRFVIPFLRGTPGIEAWSMLGKAQYHALETLPDGRPRYDTVLVDAPATGHGLDLLRVPKVILDVAPPGPLRKDAERAWSLFTDKKRAGVLLVTLPEELPTNETIELHQAIASEIGMPVCGLVINMLMPRLFSDGDRTALERLQALPSLPDELSPLLEASGRRAEREADQAEYVARLCAEIAVPRVELPLLLDRDLRRKELEALSARFG